MDNKEIGLRIKNVRKMNKMTQKKLGELINKKEVTIRKYESGEISIPTDTLKLIGDVLGINWERLLSGKDINDTIIQEDILSIINFFQHIEHPNKSSAVDILDSIRLLLNDFSNSPSDTYKLELFETIIRGIQVLNTNLSNICLKSSLCHNSNDYIELVNEYTDFKKIIDSALDNIFKLYIERLSNIHENKLKEGK